MGTSLKIMDLELDLLTEEMLCKKMAEYLSGDLFRVVHLVSLDYIDKYEEEPVVQEVLEEADLVLPGEKAILSLYHLYLGREDSVFGALAQTNIPEENGQL